MRFWSLRTGIATAAVAVSVLGVMAPADSVAASQQSGSASRSGFWIAMTPGESFGSAVEQSAVAAGRPQVISTIKDMIKNAKAGGTVRIPQGVDRNEPASIKELRAALRKAISLNTNVATQRLVKVPASLDPASFPVRGEGKNPATWMGESWWSTWYNMEYELVGEYCGPSGCTQTDTLVQYLTVNPYTSSTRVYRRGTYFHEGAANFDFIHFEWWTLCYRSQQNCSDGNTDDFYGNSDETFYTSVDVDLHRDHMANAFALWADFLPTGQAKHDDAKDAMALCKSDTGSGNNQCLFPQ